MLTIKDNTENRPPVFFRHPSGIFDFPQLQFCLSVLGAERILYSVDFPLVPHDGARAFLENAPISAADREKIAHGNAEKLLGI